MSDSVLSAGDGPDESASRESDGESAEIDQVLRELNELACQDDLGMKLAERDLQSKIGKILNFDGEYGRRFSSERWHDDRMKVMRALSICLRRSSRVWNLGLQGYEGYRLKLSFPEVEELTRGLEHSTVLKEVGFGVDLPGYFAARDESACWSRVADILQNAANLEKFRVSTFGGECNVDLLALSKALVAARNLKSLCFGVQLMDKHGAKILGQAVAMHEVMETLELGLHGYSCTELGETKDAIDCFITEAFLGPRPNRSIQRLRFTTDLLSEATMPCLESLSRLLQRNSSVADLEISADIKAVYRSCDLRTLFEALRANRSLRNFTLEEVTVDCVNPTGMGFDPGAFSVLVDWITSATHLEHLDLSFWEGSDLELDWPAFFKSLASNSTLRSLRLRMPPQARPWSRQKETEKEMVEWSRITRLKQLYIDCPFEGALLGSLGENTNIEELELRASVLANDETFRELMKLLRINSTLKQINFGNGDRGPDHESREARVREALRSKAREETYLAELRATFGTTRWTRPTCGRVFLCGNPMAGKTRLANTMLQSEAPLYTRFLKKIIPRTRGIEIQTLKNDASMQLSLWDLAGQDIFRALQEYLFPKLNKACVFLFVFSLYDREANPKALKPELEVAFEEELLYWLKFITSNSQMTGFNLPLVMVVLTHKDKTTDMGLDWAVSVLKKLQKEFEDVLTISHSLFFVNGHRKKDVQPILTQVYAKFKGLFREELFRVPKACGQVSNFLLDWVQKHEKQPVVTYKEFVSLCSDAHPALQAFLSSHSDERKMKVIQALASYLHDVGTIVALPKHNIMVVNPNWLTHTFLGSIIGTGKDFERGKKAAPPTSDNGFLLKSQFERFVKENVLLAMRKEGYSELDFKMLQMLMEGLDLCYEVPNKGGESSFFVPTLFNVEQQCVRPLRWKRRNVKDDVSYLGLRVRCKDQKRTFLSVGFFPQFQISLRRKMIQRVSVDLKLNYECKYNLISILHDGHDVLIENEEDGSFVDILVRSEKSIRSVWQFMEKHILNELYDFCASGKGPLGVTLVEDVLRTECVKQLTKCVYRKDQAVSRELLKEGLKQSIRNQEDDSRDLFKYTWSAVAGTGLADECEAAIDLLSPQDILEVREWIGSETSALIERAEKSENVFYQLCKTSSDSAITSMSREESSVENISQNSMSMIAGIQNAELQTIANRIEELHVENRNMIQELHVKIDGMKVDIMRMSAQFAKAQKTTQDSFTRLFQHMDRLIGISDTSSQLPRRPYFTGKGASWAHRLKAKLNLGDPLILHFACESSNGTHIVPRQTGFPLVVGNENKEWLRVILRNSVTVLWCLVKAGLHVTTSLGSVLPDLQLQVSDSNYKSLATLSISSVLDILTPENTSPTNVVDFGDDLPAQRAWRYLQEHLKDELVSKIPHHFSLYPAWYVDTTTGNFSAYAWLCKECKEVGIREGKIRDTLIKETFSKP